LGIKTPVGLVARFFCFFLGGGFVESLARFFRFFLGGGFGMTTVVPAVVPAVSSDGTTVSSDGTTVSLRGRRARFLRDRLELDARAVTFFELSKRVNNFNWGADTADKGILGDEPSPTTSIETGQETIENRFVKAVKEIVEIRPQGQTLSGSENHLLYCVSFICVVQRNTELTSIKAKAETWSVGHCPTRGNCED